MSYLAGLRYLLALPRRAAPRICAGLIVVSVLDAVGGVLVAVLISAAVTAVRRGDDTAVVWWTAGAALVLAVALVAHTFAFLWQAVLAERAKQLVDVETLRAVGGRPRIDHFASPDFMDDLQILRRDRGRIGTSTMVVFQCLESGVRLLVVVVTLLTVNPSLLLLPISAVAAIWAAGRAERITQSGAERAAAGRRRANALFDVLLSDPGAQESAVFDPKHRLAGRHEAELATAARLERQARWRGVLVTIGGWLMFGTGYVLPLCALVAGWPVGRPGPARLVLVIMLALLLFKAIADAYDAFGWVLRAVGTARRHLRVTLDEPAAADGGAEPLPVTALTGGITVDGVSFRYTGAPVDVLRDVRLELPAGTVVALVGENGAGKSTLLNVLIGLERPTSGRVLIDGQPLDEVSAPGLRAGATAAFQDFVRYELSLGENVGVGDVDRIADEQALTGALQRCAAADLVDRDPRGLSTPVGGDGVEFSGGQWQRIAAARAHLRSRPVLRIFDEPSAALDPDAEAALFDRIIENGRSLARDHGSITVIVSHRLSGTRSADLVIVLDRGAVLDVGTHGELIDRCPAYAELYRIQAQAYA